MNEMARQTKTVDVLDPNFFTTFVEFVTEFISLIVENVVGAAGIMNKPEKTLLIYLDDFYF